jgi:nucleoside-diphosphate-sugar epimerase
MRLLLTGANGFIGGQVLAGLRVRGHAVVIAVRHPPSLCGENGGQNIEAIHATAPIALFNACAQASVRKIVSSSTC